MKRFAQVIIALLAAILAETTLAGPREDANAVVDRWSAAYSSNDPEAVVRNYWSEAILLGTVSPVMSNGGDPHVLFTPKGEWQQERHR